MAQRETRPLYLTDAIPGRGISGFPNYVVGSPKTFHLISWECRNAVGNGALERKRTNPPKGYAWNGYMYPKSWKKKDSDAIELCFGDAWPFSWLQRRTNRFKRMYSLANKHLCCTGQLNTTKQQALCDPAWKFETAECDAVARKYCVSNSGNPICGCLLDSSAYSKSKLLGPPECIDARCAGNPKAYKTQSMIKRACPNIVNCNIDKIDISDLQDSSIGKIEFQQNCGMSLEEAIALAEKKKTEETEPPKKETAPPKETEKEESSTSEGVKTWTLVTGIGGGILVVAGIIMVATASSGRRPLGPLGPLGPRGPRYGPPRDYY